MPLSLAQIEAMAQRARDAGLSAEEVETLREIIIMRALRPGAADKLGLAITQLPEPQTQSMNAFIDASRAVHRGIMTRGKTELEAMTDDEWERLLHGD